VNVAYVFTTAGQTVHYVLGGMILPQLEEGRHGANVVGIFFFHDNTFALRKGDPLGERLGRVARERGMLLMLCDQCAMARGLAERTEGGAYAPSGVVEGVRVGCFPDLYAALGAVPDLQVISL
jgi:sulfur relay (sulfurtransferase) complex TusBCD TusD component (DsrE family)